MGYRPQVIGRRIRECRKLQGIQQSDLAARVGCEPAYISKIESGEKGLSIVRLLEIADALNVSVDDLLGRLVGRNQISAELLEIFEDCDSEEMQILIEACHFLKRLLRSR